MSQNINKCIKKTKDGTEYIKLTTPLKEETCKNKIQYNGNPLYLPIKEQWESAEPEVKAPVFYGVPYSTEMLTYLLLKCTWKTPDITFTNYTNASEKNKYVRRHLMKDYKDEFKWRTLTAEQVNNVYKLAIHLSKEIESEAEGMISQAVATMGEDGVTYEIRYEKFKDAIHSVLRNKILYNFSEEEKDAVLRLSSKRRAEKVARKARIEAERKAEEKARRRAEESAKFNSYKATALHLFDMEQERNEDSVLYEINLIRSKYLSFYRQRCEEWGFEHRPNDDDEESDSD